jgi:hypothetical protein
MSDQTIKAQTKQCLTCIKFLVKFMRGGGASGDDDAKISWNCAAWNQREWQE